MADRGAWYRKTKDEILSEHATTLREGLTREEVLRRREAFGTNVIQEATRKSPWRILLAQFSDFLVLVLIGAAVVAGFLGEPQDVIAIVAIVLLNAVLGFVQEYRAERAMEALKALAAPHARIRRHGQILQVPAFELVPGDVVLIEAGNVVPADLRLVEAAQLRIDESTLTGESVPVEKQSEAIEAEHLPVADQKNMAFKGSLVTSGRATGIVVDTGMRTELGRIATLLREEIEVKTPLQNRLARFAKNLALIVVFICIVLFAIGLSRGEEPVQMFLTALSLAVAAIPEALPAVVTVALAIGAKSMSSRAALVRKLPAVEALGSVTTICTDKTGTLTLNRMRVHAFHVAGSFSESLPVAESGARAEPWTSLLRGLALNNDAFVGDKREIQGDPTEIALLEAAQDAGHDKARLELETPRIAEIPFSSERGMMSTVHQEGGSRVVFVKGAPERVLPLCVGIEAETEARAAREMAEKGLRVLAFAYRRMEGNSDVVDLAGLERELVFLGLVGLMDPPRPEAGEAIRLCKTAGIHVVMITGDHPSTAASIARQLGILETGRMRVMTGRELSELSDDEFQRQAKEVSVYARVAPEQKIRIVKALQSAGEIAAMTGDGVNDAPALRRADVGVSMGKGGTDVAREASHMILLDDNFATIVEAVREGRRIYDNIRKFVRFALSGNSGEIWTLFLAPFLGLPLPLLPIHILWVNLVTDGLPGLALAVEPEERRVMSRPPRRPQESIFAHGLWQHTVWVGLLTAGATLGTLAWAYHTGHAHWQSMAFTVLTLIQMGHVLAIRSEFDSLFTQGLRSNLPLLGAVVLTFFLQMATLYVPAFNAVFKTQPLSGEELAACLVVSSVVFIAVEIEKWVRRRAMARPVRGVGH